MRILRFKTQPEFPDLWDACLHYLLYDKDAYVQEVLNLFEIIRVNRNSKILDTCAGTGFISLYLRQKGFSIDCMDISPDEIKTFRRKARSLRVSSKIKQLSWQQITKAYQQDYYDFLFCRGNSFIYSNGGWNEEQVINEKESLKAYESTLESFYHVLRPGGYLYIDKFPDNEPSHNDVVAKLEVGDSEEDLIFYTRRFPKERYREARMIRRVLNGKEYSVPNITYDLKEEELESLLSKVGFRNVRRLHLGSEHNFKVWLAQK